MSTVTYGQLKRSTTRLFITLGVIVVVFLLALALFWRPVMRPWTQERIGMANLAQATFDNKIRAEAAAAERDAAVLRAQAITIVGAAAKEFPEYRNQEFIGGFANALENGAIPQTFYVPTKNGIPVLPSMGQPFAGGIAQ